MRLFILLLINLCFIRSSAQNASVKARVDAKQITVGDQVKLFIEASHNEKQDRLQWAVLPDTFNTLEIVEKGKIDTSRQGDIITYKQRLLITGFDSGSFKIPAFAFAVIPAGRSPYTVRTDSFQILVQTVAVDTTKPFKGIKDIMPVKRSWLDYIWLIAGGIILVVLMTIVVLYFRKNRKTDIPVAPIRTSETLQDKTLRLLNELEQEQLWQREQIKEYYIRLTDLLRTYVEERFRTPAMELTTDELLQQAKTHPEMRRQYEKLSIILQTADLAKFAKAQPLPHEHAQAMELTKEFVLQTKPVVNANTDAQ